MSETVTASARAYRYGRTEQGQSGILWSVYEGPTPDDFQNGAKVASFVRWRDAWNYIQPFAAVPDFAGNTKLPVNVAPAASTISSPRWALFSARWRLSPASTR